MLDQSSLIRVQVGMLMALVAKAGGEVVVTHADLVRLAPGSTFLLEEFTFEGERRWRFAVRDLPPGETEPMLILPEREVEA